MKTSQLRKLINEEIKKLIKEEQSIEVANITVGQLVSFLSNLDSNMKIKAVATIESGYSTSYTEQGECEISVDGNVLIINVTGEETGYN